MHTLHHRETAITSLRLPFLFHSPAGFARHRSPHNVKGGRLSTAPLSLTMGVYEST
jgi:hypothetical protein